jgi:hypothetical protein
MPTLAREFNISLSTVHGYIEEQRKLLRKSAQKRKSSKSPPPGREDAVARSRLHCSAAAALPLEIQ